MKHRSLQLGLLVAALTFAVVPWQASAQPSRASGQVWLALSDIHLNIFDKSPRPSSYGRDANPALFASAVAEMKRVAPNPAIVLLPGDFLAHDFARHAEREGVPAQVAAIQTMRFIAATLTRAFPKAQFVIALGNNDVPCGDYRSADGDAYMQAIAGIWTPLVDRANAAPLFRAAFAQRGYYTAALPGSNLRMIVLDTVAFSNRYAGGCHTGNLRAGRQELSWLSRTLLSTPPNGRNVVMMHIPPGFDAFSTEYVRGFLALSFMKERYDAALVRILATRNNHIAYAVAGHTHRFDFRLAGSTPIVVVGSLSPIFDNNPSFYALHIASDGSLRDLDGYAFDEGRAAWIGPHAFDRTWSVSRIDGGALMGLHSQLQSPVARTLWNRQADGWPDPDHTDQAWGNAWRIPWCAQTVLVSGFAACARIEQRMREAPFLVVAIVAAVIAGLLFIISLYRRLKPRTSS